MTDENDWNSKAAEELRKHADAVSAATAPRFIGEAHLAFATLDQEAPAAIGTLTEKIGQDRAIYIITLDDTADPVALRKAVTSRRADKSSDVRLPQINPDRGDGGRVLYVGSSCATANRKRTLASRLKQHLQHAPRGTYALNLAHWASELSGGITVKVYNYPPETDREVVVAVEDQLSRQLAPICGRRGIQR